MRRKIVQCFGYITAAISPFILFEATTKPTKGTTFHYISHCSSILQTYRLPPYPARSKTVVLRFVWLYNAYTILFWSCCSILGTSVNLILDSVLIVFIHGLVVDSASVFTPHYLLGGLTLWPLGHPEA